MSKVYSANGYSYYPEELKRERYSGRYHGEDYYDVETLSPEKFLGLIL